MIQDVDNEVEKQIILDGIKKKKIVLENLKKNNKCCGIK